MILMTDIGDQFFSHGFKLFAYEWDLTNSFKLPPFNGLAENAAKPPKSLI